MKRIRLDDFEPGAAAVSAVSVNGERHVRIEFDRFELVMTKEQALAHAAAVREAAG